MYASVVSLITALVLFFGWKTPPLDADLESLIFLFSIVGAVFLFLLGIAHTQLYAPLQKAEYKITPRITELFCKDPTLKWMLRASFIFPLMSFAFAYILSHGTAIAGFRFIFPIWIFLFGVEIDLFYLIMQRTQLFFNPYESVKIIQKEAIDKAISGDETELCNWIDVLCETSMKALDNSSQNLAINAFNQIIGVQTRYVEACKKRETLPVTDPDAPPSRDRAQYVLYYIYERLHGLYAKALEKREEPVCLSIVTLLGKLSIATAKYDLPLALYPLHFVSSFTNAAISRDMPEIGIKATFMLQETGKAILSDLDFNMEGLKPLFFGLNNQLEEVSKSNFRKDKSIHATLLMKPFLELKAFLKTERMSAHPDSAAIIRDLDRVLEEFAALQQIMSRMPVPGVATPTPAVAAIPVPETEKPAEPLP